MNISKIRIISRESPLAMWQARHGSDSLRQIQPDIETEILGIKTEADQFLDKSLSSMGGKGAFIKELEQALLSNKADLAVHSMKDVTIDLPEQLVLPVIMQREDPRDAFVSNSYQSLQDLPANARVGTSSLRRRCQLKTLRPDMEIIDIRGNVGTRLAKLDNGDFDALILATAGLKRLQLEKRITSILDINELLPAVGQGALGIEIRANDSEILKIVSLLNDTATHACVLAERGMSKRLNGGCFAPIAGYATLDEKQLSLSGMVGRLDGSELIKASITGPMDQAASLGETLGQELLDKGADDILREVMNANL